MIWDTKVSQVEQAIAIPSNPKWTFKSFEALKIHSQTEKFHAPLKALKIFNDQWLWIKMIGGSKKGTVNNSTQHDHFLPNLGCLESAQNVPKKKRSSWWKKFCNHLVMYTTLFINGKNYQPETGFHRLFWSINSLIPSWRLLIWKLQPHCFFAEKKTELMDPLLYFLGLPIFLAGIFGSAFLRSDSQDLWTGKCFSCFFVF